jgi:DNA-binding beta-propeller fold protein YncE
MRRTLIDVCASVSLSGLVSFFSWSSLCSLCLCGESIQPHRSPVDVALLPGGRLALTANHTADSLSLVDLSAGRVLAELPCGRKPVAVACSPDGRRAVVSNLWSGSLSLFDVEGITIKPAGVLSVGIQPRGLVFSANSTALC